MHTPSSSNFSTLIYFPSAYVLPPLPLQGNLPSYPFPVATSIKTPHQTSRTTKFKLRSTYEREDKTFVCVTLGYTTQYNYSQFHLFTCDLHFSLWLNNIALCICMNICVSYVHGPFTGWWIAKFLPFLSYCQRSSNNHRWAEISAVWYRVSWVYGRSRMDGPEGSFISISFEKAPDWISRCLYHFLPPNSMQGFVPFPHIHTSTCGHFCSWWPFWLRLQHSLGKGKCVTFGLCSCGSSLGEHLRNSHICMETWVSSLCRQ